MMPIICQLVKLLWLLPHRPTSLSGLSEYSHMAAAAAAGRFHYIQTVFPALAMMCLAVHGHGVTEAEMS